jgi:hypothetical protein
MKGYIYMACSRLEFVKRPELCDIMQCSVYKGDIVRIRRLYPEECPSFDVEPGSEELVKG